MIRYSPARQYLVSGLLALGLALFSAWCGDRWAPAYVPAGLFLLSALGILFLALQPSICVYEDHLAIGRRVVPWSDIRRLDRTGWLSPLVVNLTLTDNKRMVLIYPGDLDSANSLLRHLRRFSKEALIDGIPHRQFWGETVGMHGGERRSLPAPRYHLLRPEDEAEVERLYQRLKTVGNLDPKRTGDDQ